MELFAKALVSTGSVSKWEKDSKTRKKVEAEVNRLVREEVNGGDITTDADIILGQLLNLTEIHSAVRALLLSATSASWTAFECVAKDSWTAALNVRPRKLGQKTIQEIGSDILNDGLSARSISVGLLAKHGFDLRNSLGTLLNEKFDFTSLKGMRKAFISAFEEREKIEEIFGGKVLKNLQAYRNIIVHKGGIVDEDFLKITSMKLKVRESVPIDGKVVSNFANSVSHAGCELLKFVDNWLSNNPAEL